MHIEILGAESLGVRGLSCVVEAEDRRVVIDPGLALGYERHGLLPHPAQVAVGEQVRRQIITALNHATDVVISHVHGDHVPLPDANPYQLKAQEGLSWLDRLSSETGHRVICAADFMERHRCLLEARRERLYEEMPVPEGWHEAYARGEADTCRYRDYREEGA